MQQLIEGLGLMIVGMGVVFCFLALLVAAMNGSAAFFKKYAAYFPEEVQPTSGLERRGDSHADIAVVIAAARARAARESS